MESVLGLQKSGVNITLYKSYPGSETKAVEKLLSSEYSVVFKALGDADIVKLADVERVLGDLIVEPNEYVTDSRSIGLLKWSGLYTSPSIVEFLKDSKLAFLFQLTLEKALYSSKNKAQNLNWVIDAIFTRAGFDAHNLAVYGGLGSVDLFAVYKASEIAELFNSLKVFRSLSIKDVFPGLRAEELFPGSLSSSDDPEAEVAFDAPVFSDTKTVPLISFQNVINPGRFSELDQQVRASILINVPPGHEMPVQEHLEKSGLRCNFSLGSHDIRAFSESDISLGSLVESVLNLRRLWIAEDAMDIPQTEWNTSTHLEGVQSEIASSFDYRYSIIFKEEPYPEVPLELKEQDFYLYSLLTNTINLLESLYERRTTHAEVYDMYYVPLSLVGEVESYLSDSRYEKDAFVAAIIPCVDYIKLGLSQRVPPELINGHNSAETDGYLTPILAAESIIRFIHDCMHKDSWTGDPDWTGFVFFSDLHGFSLKQFGIMSILAQSAYQPLSPDRNWLTITHEMSHYYFVKSMILLEYTEELQDQCIHRLGIPASNKPQSTAALENARDFVFEVFAHWFDWFHFYQGDTDFFFRNIWNCWIDLTVVRKNLEDYNSRSFTVFCLIDRNGATTSYEQNRDFDYCVERYEEYLSLVRGLDLPAEVIEQICQLEEQAIEMSYAFFPSLLNLTSKHADPALADKLNQEYALLPLHLDRLSKGQLVPKEEIENPLALLKAALRKFGRDEQWLAGPTLLLSLSQVENQNAI